MNLNYQNLWAFFNEMILLCLRKCGHLSESSLDVKGFNYIALHRTQKKKSAKQDWIVFLLKNYISQWCFFVSTGSDDVNELNWALISLG